MASKSAGYFDASAIPCLPPVEQPFQNDTFGALP
jgi:hypothetical protein